MNPARIWMSVVGGITLASALGCNGDRQARSDLGLSGGGAVVAQPSTDEPTSGVISGSQGGTLGSAAGGGQPGAMTAPGGSANGANLAAPSAGYAGSSPAIGVGGLPPTSAGAASATPATDAIVGRRSTVTAPGGLAAVPSGGVGANPGLGTAGAFSSNTVPTPPPTIELRPSAPAPIPSLMPSDPRLAPPAITSTPSTTSSAATSGVGTSFSPSTTPAR